jgi:nucleolar protein 15
LRITAATTATSAPIPPAKKSKKVDHPPAKSLEKPTRSALKKTESSSSNNNVPPSTTNGEEELNRLVKPRKKAVDFLSDDEEHTSNFSPAGDGNDRKVSSKRISRKSKTAELITTQSKSIQPANSSENIDHPKADHINEDKNENEDEHEEGPEEEPEEEPEDGGDDDQTAELLKGFESSGDEDISGDEGFDPDAPVPRVPDSKKTKRKIANRRKKIDEPEQPGTIYVGYVRGTHCALRDYCLQLERHILTSAIFQTYSSWVLRAPDARIFLPVWRHHPLTTLKKSYYGAF